LLELQAQASPVAKAVFGILVWAIAAEKSAIEEQGALLKQIWRDPNFVRQPLCAGGCSMPYNAHGCI
jgi:hypothetical protein